jgi:hypothetical protein
MLGALGVAAGRDEECWFSYLPTLRALFALNQGEPSKALEELQVAVPYELGWPGANFVGFIGALYPIYVRGDTYLVEGKGAEAALEFQRILDHRGVVVSDPIGALAHLQQGRAFVLSGDTDEAKIAYEDFFKLWKDADPDIPLLKRARGEYSKLD